MTPPTVEGVPLVKTMGRLAQPTLATVDSAGSDLFEAEWQAQMASEHPHLAQDMLVRVTDDEHNQAANMDTKDALNHRDEAVLASENPQDQIAERQPAQASLAVANTSTELPMPKSGIQLDTDESALSSLRPPKSQNSKPESFGEPAQRDIAMHAETTLIDSVPAISVGQDRPQTAHQSAEISQRTERTTRLGILDSDASLAQKTNLDVWQRMPLAETSISHKLSVDGSAQAKIQTPDSPHSNPPVSERLPTDSIVSRLPELTALPHGVIGVAQSEMAQTTFPKHMGAYDGAWSDQRTPSPTETPEAGLAGVTTASVEGGKQVRELPFISPNPMGHETQIDARSVFQPMEPEDSECMAELSIGEGRGSASVSNISAPMTMTTTPTRVVQQVVDVVRNTSESVLEVTLKPEELGKVRLTFAPSETGLHVTVLADRPETLDLMRRHFDLLESELRSLGYEGVSLSFGEGEARSDADQNKQSASGISDTASESASIPEVTSYHLTAGLDIRI